MTDSQGLQAKDVDGIAEDLKQQLKLSCMESKGPVEDEEQKHGKHDKHDKHDKHHSGHHHKDHGTDVGTGPGFQVTVSNLAGYMCHIKLEAYFDMQPHEVFTILTYPDNSALFRDIQRVGSRKVTAVQPGLKIVEAEQLQEMRFLWIHRTYSTLLTVREESHDTPHHAIQFDLLKSDVLQRFSGRWTFTPEYDQSGKVVGTWGVLTQDVLPKGIPPWITRIPMLGGAIRGGALRAVSRIMEDIQAVIPEINQAKANGQSIEDFMRRKCGPCDEAGHANAKVTSFAIEDSSEDEDEDMDEDASPCLGKEGGGGEVGEESSERRLVSVTVSSTTLSDGESVVQVRTDVLEGA